MLILDLNNSFSIIRGLDISQHKNLARKLSYKLPDNFYKGNQYFGKSISLLQKDGTFPTGLLAYVRQFLKEHNLKWTEKDLRKRPVSTERLFNLKLGQIVPYPEQIDISNIAFTKKRGIISAVTGFGKSIAIATLINQLQLKTLIIVPNLGLKNQLKESFKKYFGSLDNITIENIDSKQLARHTKYDVLIIDEAHHVAAKTYRKLNRKAWNSIYYRFFFTATPFRSRSEEQILFESIAGSIIYKIDYNSAVSNGYIVPIESYYYEIPKTRINGLTWPKVYSQLVVQNEERNKLISGMMLSLQKNNKSTLCLVKEIKHGDILSGLSGIPFANGESENSQDLIERFSKGQISTLIATTGVMGEGIDTKPAEFIIIAGLGKSKVSFMQQCGRGIRNHPGKESCKIILFYDASHKWTKNHFKSQFAICKEEYNIEPVKVEYNNS